MSTDQDGTLRGAGNGTDGDDDREEIGDADLFKAVRFCREILDHMGLDAVISTGPMGSKLINVSGPDSGLVVGRRGQTLDALHFLVNRMLHKATGKRGFVDIDVEGYRSRRAKALEAQAKDLARRVRDQGVVLSFDPMSPRDRRLVHLFLSEEPGVRTSSKGEGDGRYVQVLPIDGVDGDGTEGDAGAGDDGGADGVGDR